MTDMPNKTTFSNWSDLIRSIPIPEFDDKDTAYLILSDLDYDSQIAAIRHTLRRNQEADQELTLEIAQMDVIAQQKSGFDYELAVNGRIDRIHESFYLDAAHSMAAIGMLAPMFESIFYQTFQGIQKQFHGDTCKLKSHKRWLQATKDQWDCHFIWSNGRQTPDLVAGIMQLADATGLKKHLPKDLKQTLLALFEYRNKMFHCGFEWPVDERQRFSKRILDSHWPEEWFDQVTNDGKPWFFYMTNTFIQHCLEMIDQVICGVGAYYKHCVVTHSANGGSHGA